MRDRATYFLYITCREHKKHGSVNVKTIIGIVSFFCFVLLMDLHLKILLLLNYSLSVVH